MSGVETIAIALPAAFMASVQCFELVQFGRNFKEDFAVSAANLKICEIHLLRWGGAAGLDGEHSTKLHERLSKYPDDQLQKALLVLRRIVSIFDNTKEACQFESIDEDESSGQSAPLDENAQLQTTDAKMRKSHKHLDKIRGRYRSAVATVKRAAQDASDRTKWALYKKKHLETLVEQVSKLIERLEKLFPELLEVEKKMARQEAETAEKEVVQALPAMAAKIDPVMAEALILQMTTYGMTFENIEAGDDVRAHMGNAYAPGENSTGHDDHHFKGVKLSGNVQFHGGNYYGFKQDPTVGGARDVRK